MKDCSSAVCPCGDPCPLERTLDMVGGKWKIRIICALNADGTLRYNELRRRVQGVTNTMLARSLRELEEDGLVTRQLFDERPIRVEYAPTKRAAELAPILEQLADWGRNGASS